MMVLLFSRYSSSFLLLLLFFLLLLQYSHYYSSLFIGIQQFQPSMQLVGVLAKRSDHPDPSVDIQPL
jgi:hypothetical protein